MNDNNNPIRITVEYDDGHKEEKEVGSIFTVDNKTYACLFSDKTPINGEVEFIRLVSFTDEENQEDFYIEALGSQEEYETVVSAFNKYLDDILQEDEVDSDEDGITLFLTSPNGEEEKCKVLNIFNLNKRDYAVLYYEDKNTIDFMRVEITDKGLEEKADCHFDSITNEFEFERVKEYYIEHVMSDSASEL